MFGVEPTTCGSESECATHYTTASHVDRSSLGDEILKICANNKPDVSRYPPPAECQFGDDAGKKSFIGGNSIHHGRSI